MDEHDASRLKNVGQIARLINSGSDLDTILDHVVHGLCRYSVWTMSGIMSVDVRAGLTRQVKRFDPFISPGTDLPTRWDLATSPAAEVIESGRQLIITDAQNQDRYPGYGDDARRRGYHTVVVVPLGIKDQEGQDLLLSVTSIERLEVSDAELAFLDAVANLAAIAVEKAQRLQSERAAAERMQHAVEVYSDLMPRVLSGDSLQPILDQLDPLFQQPWLVVDLTINRIHAGHSPIPQQLHTALWHQFAQGPGRAALIDVARRAEGGQFRRISELRLDGPNGLIELDALVEPLQVDDESVGSLILFPEDDVLDSVDTLMAEAVRFALSVQLLRHVVRFRSESATWSDLFDRLFDGDWHDENDILTRASRLDFDLAHPTKLIAISTRRDSSGKDAGGPSLDLHRATARLAERVLKSLATVVHKGDIVIVLAEEYEPKTGNLDQFVRELKWLLQRPPTLTISDQCARLDQYPVARQQCERLLRLAETLGVSGVVSERNFGSLAALISTADRDAIRRFLEAQVGPVIIHDRSHKMSLLATLKTFVEHEGRYQASADALGIHVTTLRYRLQRLGDLIGVDLTDRAQRFDMLLAMKLHELIDPTE